MVYGLQIIMLLDSLIIFIIIIMIMIMMPIGAAKQRRNGIAEPRSGRSDGEGERGERWRGGAGAAEECCRGVAQRTKRERGGAFMMTAAATSTI